MENEKKPAKRLPKTTKADQILNKLEKMVTSDISEKVNGGLKQLPVAKGDGLLPQTDKLTQTQLQAIRLLAEGWDTVTVTIRLGLGSRELIDLWMEQPAFVKEYNTKVLKIGVAQKTERIKQKRFVADAILTEIKKRLQSEDGLEGVRTIDLSAMAMAWMDSLEKTIGVSEEDHQGDFMEMLKNHIANRRQIDVTVIHKVESQFPTLQQGFEKSGPLIEAEVVKQVIADEVDD